MGCVCFCVRHRRQLRITHTSLLLLLLLPHSHTQTRIHTYTCTHVHMYTLTYVHLPFQKSLSGSISTITSTKSLYLGNCVSSEGGENSKIGAHVCVVQSQTRIPSAQPPRHCHNGRVAQHQNNQQGAQEQQQQHSPTTSTLTSSASSLGEYVKVLPK